MTVALLCVNCATCATPPALTLPLPCLDLDLPLQGTMRFFMGHCAWGPGELERQVEQQGAWAPAACRWAQAGWRCASGRLWHCRPASGGLYTFHTALATRLPRCAQQALAGSDPPPLLQPPSCTASPLKLPALLRPLPFHCLAVAQWC